jgi:hypothetical protein
LFHTCRSRSLGDDLDQIGRNRRCCRSVPAAALEMKGPSGQAPSEGNGVAAIRARDVTEVMRIHKFVEISNKFRGNYRVDRSGWWHFVDHPVDQLELLGLVLWKLRDLRNSSIV